MVDPQGCTTVKSDDDDDTTTGSSQSSSFNFSPVSAASSCSATSNDVDDDTKDTTVTPFATIFEGSDVDDDHDTSTNLTKEPNIRKPRTRSSTVFTSKQGRKQLENQPQTRKRKKQPMAPKSKRRASVSESSNGGRKSQAGARTRKRIAASKCRQKKKEWLLDLEASKYNLESHYKSLNSEWEELLVEVTLLKNFLMMHGACSDPNIDEWIRIETSSYVRSLSQNTEPQAAAAASPAQNHQSALKGECNGQAASAAAAPSSF